jgi:hypothetical protein
MSPQLVYIDASEVHKGALDELRGAIGELADFIEENGSLTRSEPET